MKLIWGLQQKKNDGEHSPFVYDMFYVSIQMAKDLGYDTVLYGTSNVINKLGHYVDETFNTDNVDYILYDDLKFHIWETRTDDYILLDGDVFLHSPLHFKKSAIVSVDMVIKKQKNGYAKECLDVLNNFDIIKELPEWNTETGLSFSTGLVRWKGNNGLLKYYIQTYKKLKDWFLLNKVIVNELHKELDSSKSLLSHYLCEHLLHRIVDYYGLEFDVLDNENSYYHWQGRDKFENDDKVNCIKLIATTHKQNGGTIKDTYDSLLKDGLIKPLLFP